MLKRILAALVIVIALYGFGVNSLVAQTATAPAGAGTAEDPYQIATLNNLYWMRVQTETDAAGFFAGKYFIQTADIDASPTETWFEGQGFQPIAEFKGTYDGNNKIISNLYIARPSDGYLGLFGLAHACTIQNLGLHGVNISGSQYVGAIAGTAIRATITNCYSTGSISASGLVGGLVGNITVEYNTGSHIRNCFSSCDIIGGGGWSFGGLVGEMNYTLAGSSIENSYSTGRVSGGNAVGGIAGRCNESTMSSIQNCYTVSTVTGSGEYIGGLVGNYVSSPGAGVGAAITNCYWNTEMTAASAVGTGRTTAQMKDQSTFSGWNFTSPWAIDANKNSGYPYLAWQTFNAPTTQARALAFASVSYTGMTINWTRGNGSKRVVFMKAGASGTASPLDKATYTANAAFGSGTQLGSTGWYCVYNGAGSSVTVSGLNPGTQYITQVFDYNGIAGAEMYLSASAADNPKVQLTGELVLPGTQANTITFSTVNTTSFAMGWTNGDGAKRAVFVKAGNSGTAAPVTNTTYTASATFAAGTQIGSTGWFCVYNGTGTSVTITGLTPGTDYVTQVCEYNGAAGEELYLTSSASGNPSVQQTLGTPSVQAHDVAFSSVTYSGMTVTWANGNGMKRAVFIRQAASGTASPASTTTYTANTAFGSGTQIGTTGWFCIYNGTGTSVAVTGLSPALDYTVHVCEYNGDPGGELYSTASATNDPSSRQSAAVPVPSTQATSITFSSVIFSGMTIGWTNGNGEQRVVFVKQANSGTASPVNGTTYTASTTFGSGTQIGSTGWYCVYKGTGTGVSISGLSASQEYIVQVCEYNGPVGYETFLTTGAADNPKVQLTAGLAAPSTQAHDISFPSTAATSITLGWTNGDGGRRIVFAKAGDSGTASPVDNTTYTANTTLGSGTQIGTTGWYCVYNGTGTSVTVSGLTPLAQYIFQVIEYNGDAGGELYSTATGATNPAVQQTSLTDPPAAGDGSSGNPYQIASLYNLNWLVQNSGVWSRCFLQTANIDLAPCAAWNGGTGFGTLGNGSTNFSGSYDGGGYVISNLTMTRSGSDDQGFFGVVSGTGRIKSLGLVNASVSGNDRVGALAGLVNAGAGIIDCFTTGSVSGVYGDVGGLVGENHGSITRSYSTCNIAAGYNYSSGGLIGYNTSGNVSNCYATGSVVGSGGGKGGLVGNNTASAIANCYSTSPQGLVGGFFGGGSCSASYWDNSIAGGSAAGAGVSDASMKNQATFGGWDFATPVWKIDANNNGYPYLAWQKFSPTLPVELVSYKAVAKEGSVLLNWSTATETNNYGFEIERSLENAQHATDRWEKIGFVEGSGYSNAPREYSFVDSHAPAGMLQYRLKQIDRDGQYKYCAAVARVNVAALAPKEFSLSQNYPNPFNPSTKIEYRIADQTFVTLKVYDVLGNEVATLVNEQKAAGAYHVTFDAVAKSGRSLSSGVYLYKLTAGSFISVRQLMLIK